MFRRRGGTRGSLQIRRLGGRARSFGSLASRMPGCGKCYAPTAGAVETGALSDLFLEPFRSFILMGLLHNAGVFLIIIIPCR